MNISQEQKRLIETIEAVNLACSLTGVTRNDVTTVFHHQACNNSPGWNVFLQNIRFELGYGHNKIRFSIPPEEDKLAVFCEFLKSKLQFNTFEYTYRTGIKYIFEIDLENHIHTVRGIRKIARLINVILDFKNFEKNCLQDEII